MITEWPMARKGKGQGKHKHCKGEPVSQCGPVDVPPIAPASQDARNCSRTTIPTATMTTVVKFYCDDGEIFRRQLPEEPTFEAIMELAKNCRPDVAQKLREGGACVLKYADDEGDLCTLAPATFPDFLSLQRRSGNSRLLKLTLTLQTDQSRRLPPGVASAEDTVNAAGSEGVASPGSQDIPIEREDETYVDGDRGDADAANGEHAGAWGPAGCPWKLMGLLSTLRMLKESGALAAMLPCVAVQWLPFLTTIVARKVEKINRRAQEGLDPSLQKMLEIIQDFYGFVQMTCSNFC
eukprot:g21524.t1